MATTTPLTMVAVGSDLKQKAKEETTKIAAVAATYELRKPGRPITLWHPRAAPKDRERWTEEVQENLRTAAPGIPAYILNGPPTIQQVTTIYKGASQEAITVHSAAAMLEYQMYNTALWDAIEPSLRFEGAYESMDRLQKRDFMNNDLSDAFGHKGAQTSNVDGSVVKRSTVPGREGEEHVSFGVRGAARVQEQLRDQGRARRLESDEFAHNGAQTINVGA